MSEGECKTIEETLYLLSIAGFVNNVNEIRKNENWKTEKEYNFNEEW